MFSLVLVPADGEPLAAALPGQFVVLRLHMQSGAPPVLRSYSLSNLPGTEHYRVSIKLEEKGLASAYLRTRIKAGSNLEVSAPRGTFTLRTGGEPVVLLSGGVGATPVLAMLHALAAEKSSRPVWWLHGARNREEHPFRNESRALVQELRFGHSYIQYSRPGPADQRGVDFNAVGHLAVSAFDKIGVPHEGQFYLCGPPEFLRELTAGLATWGVLADHVHTEIFGTLDSITPGMKAETSCSAFACGTGGFRTASFLRAERSDVALGCKIREPARTCRSVRCARAVVLSNRGLPHLRNGADCRRRGLRPGAARSARAGRRAYLLQPSSG